MTSRDSGPSRPIVVLGAGIAGLTTAIRLLESTAIRGRAIPVHILADHFPNDPIDPRYASTVAGAHHLSFADDGDDRQRRWDRETFRTMYDEWERLGEITGLMRIKQTEYYVGTSSHLKIYEEHPDFSVLETASQQLPFHIDHCVTLSSLTMTPLVYLTALLERLRGLGAIVHRRHLSSLRSLIEPSARGMLGAAPLAIVVCAGLGATSLDGVNDPDVFPTRGQIVKVRAPWIREGYTRQVGLLGGAEGGERTYVIPRANGDVILGGTRDEGDWDRQVRPETSEDILRRALEICPALQPPRSAEHGATGPATLDDLVVEHLVGFRPSRNGGTRLERGPDLVADDITIPVIYNYGHGGAGWQSCWGTATDAVTLVESAVA